MNPVRIIYVLSVVTALALCLVWQTREVRQAGYRLEELRREAECRQTEVHVYQAHVSKLKTPQRILKLVESLGLPLQQSSPQQPAVAGRDDAATSLQTAHRQPQAASD